MPPFRKPWPLAPGQGWRWRYPRLWRGRCFDPHSQQEVLTYAVLRLRTEVRDVFLLNHFEALDCGRIGRRLGLSDEQVQACLADALFEIVRTVDLIERARPKPITLSHAEHPDV